jgi:hypothetical protein
VHIHHEHEHEHRFAFAQQRSGVHAVYAAHPGDMSSGSDVFGLPVGLVLGHLIMLTLVALAIRCLSTRFSIFCQQQQQQQQEEEENEETKAKAKAKAKAQARKSKVANAATVPSFTNKVAAATGTGTSAGTSTGTSTGALEKACAIAVLATLSYPLTFCVCLSKGAVCTLWLYASRSVLGRSSFVVGIEILAYLLAVATSHTLVVTSTCSDMCSGHDIHTDFDAGGTRKKSSDARSQAARSDSHSLHSLVVMPLKARAKAYAKSRLIAKMKAMMIKRAKIYLCKGRLLLWRLAGASVPLLVTLCVCVGARVYGYR